MMRKIFFVLCILGLLTSSSSGAEGVGEVYKRVKASVVVIETTHKEPDPISQSGLVSVTGLGSGVLISKDGRVITAAHVVQAADSIQVNFMSGESIPARVLASEPAADLALLQLARRPAIAQVAPLGDSDRAQVGDQVFVVGAPLSLTHSLTVGHVSARRVDDQVFGGLLPTEMLQTDAAINQGNSGGPMFNLQGEVVGVVSHIISQGGGFEGLGFVITSNMARRLLLEQRTLWSGFEGQFLEGAMARLLNVPQSRAILVLRVANHSPATHLGLQGGTITAQIGEVQLLLGGDIILDAMGVSLADPQARQKIRTRMDGLKNGDEMKLTVLRGGEVVELANYFFRHILIPSTPDEASTE